MFYKLYLQVISQLSSKETASVALEDAIIDIRWIKEQKRWRLSMPLLQGLTNDSSVRACMMNTGILRWQQTGAHLKLDSSETIFLIDEIQIKENGYLSFKKKIEDFIHISQEWKEILFNHSKS